MPLDFREKVWYDKAMKDFRKTRERLLVLGKLLMRDLIRSGLGSARKIRVLLGRDRNGLLLKVSGKGGVVEFLSGKFYPENTKKQRFATVSIPWFTKKTFLREVLLRNDVSSWEELDMRLSSEGG